MHNNIYSSTENLLSPISVSDWLIFCYANLILHQKKEWKLLKQIFWWKTRKSIKCIKCHKSTKKSLCKLIVAWKYYEPAKTQLVRELQHPFLRHPPPDWACPLFKSFLPLPSFLFHTLSRYFRQFPPSLHRQPPPTLIWHTNLPYLATSSNQLKASKILMKKTNVVT